MYTIGVASGFWKIEKPAELLGIPKKIEWTLTKGVNHAQVDLETVTEFKEPNLKEKIEKHKRFGVTFGIHGECAAIGMDTLPLASALEPDYMRSHDRLITHITEAGKIGAQYVTIHSSESLPFVLLGRELQPTTLVDIWGRPFKKFLDEHKDLLDWAIERDYLTEIFMHRYPYTTIKDWAEARIRELEWELKREDKKLTGEQKEEIRKATREEFKKKLLNFVSTTDLAHGSERVAYYITAKWMQDNRDYIWNEIVGKRIKDDDFNKPKFIEKWVPAVAAKYTWGHFCPNKCPTKSDYKDPKPLLKKHKMYFCFETPMSTPGYEGYMRLVRLPHLFYLVRSIGSEYVGFTMDMEHMLGCNLDPKKDIAELPGNAGKFLKVVHLTIPTPLNPSHQTIKVGSEAQYYIYERLYELRKKGFEKGWLIFERAGGPDPIQQSVLAMRIIKSFLEKGIPPKKLPLEFFGMKPTGPEVKRQEVAIKEHAFDPIKGMLMVPEEEYTFLSKAATEKGKAEVWKKEKYR